MNSKPGAGTCFEILFPGLGDTVTEDPQLLEALPHGSGSILVVTDMTMPKMTGDQLAEAIHAIRPDIPIILCTGHSEKISEDEAATLGINAFLKKPIQLKELARSVRQLLDQNRFKC